MMVGDNRGRKGPDLEKPMDCFGIYPNSTGKSLMCFKQGILLSSLIS